MACLLMCLGAALLDILTAEHARSSCERSCTIGGKLAIEGVTAGSDCHAIAKGLAVGLTSVCPQL
jgi:hypothetical protein